MKRCLEKIFLLLLLLTVQPLHAAEWVMSREANTVSCSELSGEIPFAVTGDAPCRWYSAWGMELQKNGDGLAASKTIGEEAHLMLAYEFPMPVTSLQINTPLFNGVDLSAGEIAVEYAAGKPENFKTLALWHSNSPEYVQGGSIAPALSQEAIIAESEAERLIFIRIRLKGYAGQTDFAGKGSIIFTMTPDRAGEVDLKLFPDHRKAGYVWRVDAPFRFTCKADAVESAVITNAATGGYAGEALLTPQGPLLRGDLPQLDCGTYEITFNKYGAEPYGFRFVLVPPPRALTFAEMRRSPFGIVGISRTEGFREFKPVDGPAIAQLIGVHQERSSMGGWVNVNSIQGEYNFGMSPAEAAEFMTGTGILQRCNLAWTPDWAVDHERIKQDNYTGWTGHYPPADEHFDDYQEFCRRLAEHFGDSIIAEYEIWNEPNNEPFASFKGNFDEFVRLCKCAADGVHAADPDARMILGTTGDADVGFIARLLQAGLSADFALVDIHPYRHTSQGPEDGLLGDINRLKRAIELYGDGQGIIFSEVGWPTTRIDTGGYGKVTEMEQACFNTRTLLISLAAGVERVHFHMMEDWGGNPDSAEENFGFFKVDGSPKLAVGAMAGATRHLEGAEFIGRMDTEELVHAWYWNTPWEENMVLVTVWADTQVQPAPQDVILPGCAIYAFDIFGGSADSGRVFFDGSNTVVCPGADPLYIYMPADNLPGLTELPIDLRPWLKKRAEAPIADTGKSPDYGNMRYPFVNGAELKTMGFAGIESDAVKTAVEISDSGNTSAFDVCYDEEAVRFSFRIMKDRPWQNKQSGWWLWAGDCIRIYLGKGESAFMHPQTYQLCLAPDSAQNTPALAIISYDSVSGLQSGELLPAEITAEAGDDRWLLSVRIRWKDLGMKPAKGDIWHLDINGAGGYWNNPGSDCWTNPSHWGEIIFE